MGWFVFWVSSPAEMIWRANEGLLRVGYGLKVSPKSPSVGNQWKN
jgi:hypothetical protein